MKSELPQKKKCMPEIELSLPKLSAPLMIVYHKRSKRKINLFVL